MADTFAAILKPLEDNMTASLAKVQEWGVKCNEFFEKLNALSSTLRAQATKASMEEFYATVADEVDNALTVLNL